MKKIKRVAVAGAGYMGGGIAQSLAIAGFDVVIADVSPEHAEKNLQRLILETREFEDQGLFGEGASARVQSNLSAAKTIEEAVSDVDFVEEAVSEVVETKHDVLRRVCEATAVTTIIGSNTSTIPVNVLKQAVTRPERFLTVHWSNPAPFIPGVELVVSDNTDKQVITAVQDMLERAGRSSAIVADSPGFVLNRLQYVLLKEAMSIVEEGISTSEDIDTIVRTTFGFRLPFFGPFMIADMAGLDVYGNGFSILEEAYGKRFAKPKLLANAVEEGKFGTKSGAGLLGDFSSEEVTALVKRRSQAYSRLAALIKDLDMEEEHSSPGSK